MPYDKSVLNTLPAKAEEIIASNTDRDTILLEICKLLRDTVPVYDWVGFYIADPETVRELYLGPYVGEATDHTRIPFGKGICGQVAESHKTFVVEDVHAQDNYLSCNIHVKSEIVVPILKNGDFVAQLDIDSNTLAAMDAHDQQVLEDICVKLSPLF
ncbi:MAG: GAF domain-containing protein [Candidatus Cyclonatronum sp.]|uniref:GAF domain-containing protein n=1 Tax=Cyclonatronum sp. TaxID=3024185 RepID=UPI0025BD93D6|nr:GAF domain-containing protein [Cyclonatronum sp.]MCC5933003.1 GAF domain-containing protein [Balneolales bacterium]MCH8485280.1 GAF domain-containing protein [Cyclonatronum sp.]